MNKLHIWRMMVVQCRNCVVVAMLFAVMGCSATGQEYSGTPVAANENMAVVYIYRPSRFMLAGSAPDIYINDQLGFRLRNNGYNVVRLSPGNHVITPKTNPTWDSYLNPKLLPTELTVAPNTTYFLKLNLDNSGFRTHSNEVRYEGQAQLVPVDEATARAEMVGTKLSD